jgi:hypothetical protein
VVLTVSETQVLLEAQLHLQHQMTLTSATHPMAAAAAAAVLALVETISLLVVLAVPIKVPQVEQVEQEMVSQV